MLISDGEDLDGQGLQEAKQAAKQGIRIYTIGIGSEEVPLFQPTLLDSRQKLSYGPAREKSIY